MPLEDNIELRNEEVSEILSSIPGWIFRWGISVIFILIFVAVALSYYIRYPDILSAEITLTTLNPPVNLISKNSGKITHLLVKNNDRVKTGQGIAVIENTANFMDIAYLLESCSTFLNSLKLGDTLPNIILRENLKTGELTPAYLLVLKSIKDLNLYRETNSFKQRVFFLKKDLVNYNDLLEKYKRQLMINAEELSLIEKDYNRDMQLFNEGTIPAREFENKKKDYLRALNVHEQMKVTVSNALIQINSTEKNILQEQIQDFEEQAKFRNEVQQNLKSLISEITRWKQLYLVESPVEGKVSFFSFWTENQNIQTGEKLFSIIPDQEQQFIGKCILPVENTGKLEIGQNVNIKLTNYSHIEYGMLHGVVKNISEVPDKDTYSIDVELKNGLTTSYNRRLIYKEEMKGKADIITKNLSVMDRIFFNFRKLLERN